MGLREEVCEVRGPKDAATTLPNLRECGAIWKTGRAELRGVHGVSPRASIPPPPYHSRMRFRLLLTLLIGLAPLRAAAQPVVGVVVEEGTGVPVSGAMVILFDESGDQVDRMLTNAAGQFALEARTPGTHYVTVERIGYANVTTARFTAGSDEVVLAIDAPIEPVALIGLDVEAGRRCEVRPEEGRVTARVWEEVRKALAAEAWTREASLYTYTLERFERTLDRDADVSYSRILRRSRRTTRPHSCQRPSTGSPPKGSSRRRETRAPSTMPPTPGRSSPTRSWTRTVSACATGAMAVSA